jgi:hypothetical protein
MRISDQPHILLKGDITGVAPSRSQGRTFGELLENIYIRATDDGVLIEAGVENCNIQANQLLQVRLTKNDIANLVRITWGHEALDKFIEALSKRGGKRKSQKASA